MINILSQVSSKLQSKKVIFSLFIIFLMCSISCSTPELLPENQRKLTFNIKASSDEVYDATSQVVMDYGLTIDAADAKIGFIKTDYAPIKSSFGNQLLLGLFGRKHEEYMLNLQIKGSRTGSTLNIVPKGRVKKKSGISEEYESIELSKSFLKRIQKIGDKIKMVAEGDEYTDNKASTQSRYAENSDASKLKIIVRKANVRLKPSLNSSIVVQLPFGEVLDVKQKVGDWYKITLQPDESGFVISGYIHKSTVEVIE